MFGFRRRSGLSWLLALLGLGCFLRGRRMSSEERAEIRQKGKAFRAKLREAWAVWEDEAEPPVNPEEQA